MSYKTLKDFFYDKKKNVLNGNFANIIWDSTHIDLDDSKQQVYDALYRAFGNRVYTNGNQTSIPPETYKNITLGEDKKVTLTNMMSVGQFAFSESDIVNVKTDHCEFEDGVFSSCLSLVNVNVLNTEVISDKMFMLCNALKSVTIGEGCTLIGASAFYNCSGLTNITMPNSIKSIGISSFEYCRALPSVTIPASVTRIGDFAFFSCDNLTSVIIPDSVTRIGKCSFLFCNKLTNITYLGTKEQWKLIRKSTSFNSKYTIHCTDGDIVKS